MRIIGCSERDLEGTSCDRLGLRLREAGGTNAGLQGGQRFT